MKQNGRVGDGVCGSDHVTYRNVCDLKRAACVKRSNVTVISQLPCGELVLLNYFTIYYYTVLSGYSDMQS